MVKQQSQDQSQGHLGPGTVIDGRYKITRFIGQGGNGLVHEVEHVLTGRRLAIKSLVDESGYGRLEQEARATCLMRNAHTVRITDMGRNESTGPYLVMELLEGQSLRALLEEAGQIPLELCVNIALQVCECLTEAHDHRIIHRDLKPENIFLCESDWPGQYDVRVLDFGVVKINQDGPIPNSSLTRTGSTVGTPYYMSLEQLRNPSTVDARADIYALGVVLYESLSGRKPFQAETIGDLVYALCSGPPTHLSRLRPDLPTEICDAVMRALSMKREDRQNTMTELASVLLPHGNPAFALWVRVNGKRPALAASAAAASAAAASGPARGAGMRGTALMPPNAPAQSPAPGGIPRPAAGSPAPPAALAPQAPIAPPAPIAPLAPAVGIVANSGGASVTPLGVGRSPQTSMTEAYVMPDAKPEAAAAKLLPDVEAPTRIRPERPDIDLRGSRDRDTPTEMYVKDRHDSPSPAKDRDTPTRGFPLGSSSEALVSPFPPDGPPIQPPNDEDDYGTMRYEPPSEAGAANKPRQASEMLGTMRLPTDGAVAEVRAALNAQQGGMPGMPGMPQPPHSQPGMGGMPGAPSYGQPPQIRMQPMQGMGMMAPPGIGTATLPPGMKTKKPGWQTSLDAALVGVGSFFEGIVKRIKSAPPQTQLIMAAVAASLVAAILVIVIYMMLG